MTKEEFYLTNEHWFHATTLKHWGNICKIGIQIDYNKGMELDFGYGFYLMPNKESAERYIENLIKFRTPDLGEFGFNEDKSEKIAVIIEFKFKPGEILNSKDYKYKFFTQYDDEFAEFVFLNRSDNVNGEKQHNFDIIMGVMSDSNPNLLLNQYKSKEITRGIVIEQLKKSTSVKQLSLHNQTICDTIRPQRSYIISTGEELNVNDYCVRDRHSAV